MQDEETGSWWQQVTGEAIFGPLRGRQARPRCRTTRCRSRSGRTSIPPAGCCCPIPRSSGRREYAPARLGRAMTTTPTVTALPADSPLPARTLVVGVEVERGQQGLSARSRARGAGAGRHRGRCADRGRGGRGRPVGAGLRSPRGGQPIASSCWCPAPAGRCSSTSPTGTEWSFAGEALRGPLSGPAADPRAVPARLLVRLADLSPRHGGATGSGRRARGPSCVGRLFRAASAELKLRPTARRRQDRHRPQRRAAAAADLHRQGDDRRRRAAASARARSGSRTPGCYGRRGRDAISKQRRLAVVDAGGVDAHGLDRPVVHQPARGVGMQPGKVQLPRRRRRRGRRCRGSARRRASAARSRCAAAGSRSPGSGPAPPRPAAGPRRSPGSRRPSPPGR